MAKAFADITFTPSVKAAQARYGARESNLFFEESEERGNILGANETAFIEARDSFYMATVNEHGWPYVQHRGGPVGFLKVLDDNTIGFADFRGNRQYLSVGNLNANDRISLILMDYPNKRRLKLWGRSRIVHFEEDHELIASLEVSTYRARVERALVIDIDAIEWNCPQHITPRFSQDEVDGLIHPLMEENARLKSISGQPYLNGEGGLGNGPLALKVTGVRQLTPRVRAYELRSIDGSALPVVTPGANIKVPVVLDKGEQTVRNYSICCDVNQRDYYEIAVLNEELGSGGSRAVHEIYRLGTTLHCALPENHFSLHSDERPAVLIAGGIGITPLKAMVHTLKNAGRPFHLHYAGRALEEMAFHHELTSLCDGQLSIYNAAENIKMNVTSLLDTAAADAVFYVCGPGGLIDAVKDQGKTHGIEKERIRAERFIAAPGNKTLNQSLKITLKRSGKVIAVPAEQTVLEAILAAGVNAPYSCQTGECKTCAVKVLEGEPEHRDEALSEDERIQQKLMCPCVSRAKSNALILDI